MATSPKTAFAKAAHHCISCAIVFRNARLDSKDARQIVGQGGLSFSGSSSVPVAGCVDQVWPTWPTLQNVSGYLIGVPVIRRLLLGLSVNDQ